MNETPQDDPAVLEQAKALLKEHVVGKKTEDFLVLSPNNRHFLFKMRMYYEKHVNENKPFFCSPKQLKFMKDLIDEVRLDGGESKRIETAFNSAVARLRKQFSPLITKEAEKVAAELGMDRKKIRRVIAEKVYGDD